MALDDRPYLENRSTAVASIKGRYCNEIERDKKVLFDDVIPYKRTLLA